LNQPNAIGILKFPANTVTTNIPNGHIVAGMYGTDKYDVELLDDVDVKDGLFISEFRLKAKFKWQQSYLENELSKDYDVRACTNGREALSEVLHTKPDLVVSDVMMPEMDGNTLCSKIKTNPSTNHIPVILLTAKNRDEDKLEGLETGADSYIVKPFNMDILRRIIINLLNSHRLLQLKYGRNDSLEEQVEDVKMKSPDEKLLDRVMAAINEHLDDSDLSVDMIAEQVGISRVHLHRKMKELTGQTPHDFIRNLRLKQAANLLANHGMNVTEVMYACGFSNSASFSTVFKKFYGMSPRDYMKEHYKQSH
jgi:YesN/AraC family two-component response regulator